jgi:cellulose synthase operon protein C
MTPQWLFLPLLIAAVPAQAKTQAAADAALIRGVAALNQGKPGEARVELLNAIQASPDWALAHAVQGRILLSLGDGQAAEGEINQAIASGMPRNRVNHLLAHAFLLQGNAERALTEVSPDQVAPRYSGYAARIRGRALLAQNRFNDASAEFDAALRATPNSSELWADIAQFRNGSADVAGAIQAAAHAVKLNPNNITALMLSGQLVRGQYGLIAAIPWYQRVIAINPHHIPAMLELAATLGDAGRARDMLAMTRKVLAIDKGNGQAFYLQAVLAARASKPELARALLYRAGTALDMLPAAMLLKAVIDLQSGNFEQAISQLRILVELQPDNNKARRLLGSALWRAGDTRATIDTLRPIAERADADSYTLSLIGRAYERAGDRGMAAGYLDRASLPIRGDATAFGGGAQLTLLARANSERPNDANVAIPYIRGLIGAGRSADALAQAHSLERSNPGVPAANIILGDALAASGRLKEAIAAYQRAANSQFTEPVALRLIEALRRDGQGGAAAHVLALFLSQNPSNVPALLLTSQNMMQAGQWDAAIKTLQAVRERIGNRDATILNNLAWAWFMKGDAKRGLAFADAAYRLAPTNPAVANTLGWIRFQSGVDRVGGLQLLEKAVAISPNHPGMRYQLGQAYAKAGKREQAKAQLRAALDVSNFPDRAQAQALLGKL